MCCRMPPWMLLSAVLVLPVLSSRCAANKQREQCTAGWNSGVGVQEKGVFEDMKHEEVEVLQQMFFGVVLCALATLAAKGDVVYTALFMGAVAATASYWLSDRGHRWLDGFLK